MLHNTPFILEHIQGYYPLSRVKSDDIKEGMVEQGVTDIRRISVRHDGVTKLTNTYVLNSPNLTTVVKIGFMQVKVDVYIPNLLRCYHCQVFGHHENKCGRHAVCCNCGEPEHCGPSGVCDKPAKCVNCSGDHPANSKQCPQWEKEKKILKIKCENNLSFPVYEQFYTGQTYASAVKPGTCNKSTQNDNKSTQTDDSFTEYIKQTTEKTQGTQEKRNSSPHPGKRNSSHPGPSLKPATLEMIEKDKEKKKEKKDKLKKQKKRKENSNGKKNKHRKKKNKHKKQNKLKRIHILWLLKKMARRSWKMGLWFSQSHLTVITSLKAHCHDYH